MGHSVRVRAFLGGFSGAHISSIKSISAPTGSGDKTKLLRVSVPALLQSDTFKLTSPMPRATEDVRFDSRRDPLREVFGLIHG